MASIHCSVEPAKALRFLGDGLQLGRWGLGSMNTVRVGPGLYRGTSLFNDSSSLIKPVTDHTRQQVDYWVGNDAKHLTPRIIAKVVPDDETCIVSLIAWRTSGMSEARWLRLQACHETEVHLIQSFLENTTPQRRRTAS